MSSNDETENMHLLDKTMDVKDAIEGIMKEKDEVVRSFTKGSPEARLLLKELMMTGYIAGFFAGVKNASKDPERHQN